MAIAIILNVLDFITGTAAAFKTRTICSSRMRDGLFKKLGFVILYVTGYAWEHYGHDIGLPGGGAALTAICVYVSAIELISLTENLHKLNPDIVPKKILSILKGVNDDENKNGNA